MKTLFRDKEEKTPTAGYNLRSSYRTISGQIIAPLTRRRKADSSFPQCYPERYGPSAFDVLVLFGRHCRLNVAPTRRHLFNKHTLMIESTVCFPTTLSDDHPLADLLIADGLRLAGDAIPFIQTSLFLSKRRNASWNGSLLTEISRWNLVWWKNFNTS